MKGMFGDSALGKVVAGCVLVVAVGFGLIPQSANASTVNVAGDGGSDVAVSVSALYTPTPAWKGSPILLVKKTEAVGVDTVGSVVITKDPSPIVTVETETGVGADASTTASSDAPVTEAVDASPKTVVPEAVVETPEVPVPVAPAVDAQPKTETETKNVAPSEPNVGIGDAVVIIPDPVTSEPIQLTEVFECYYGTELLKVVYDFSGCDDVFASFPVVEGDGGAVGGGGWVKRIVLAD